MNKISKLFITATVLTLSFCVCHAKTNTGNTGNFHIKIEAPQLKNSDIYLGQYFLGKLYSKDTIRLNKKGYGELESQEKYPEGMYVLYFNQSKFFDLILGSQQQFSVRIDTTDIPRSVQVTGKGETPDFFQYTLKLIDKQKHATELNQELKQSNDSNRINDIKAELALLNEAFKADKTILKQKYPNSMTSLFLDGLQVPEFQQETDFSGLPENKKDSLQILERYMFYSRHYLDNLDLADERTYHTPYCMNTVDRYLNEILIQSYDSIIPQALALVERSRASDECFKYMCSHILNYAVKSNIMGMDSLLVALADRYYLNGVATWADSTLLDGIKTEVNKIRRCLVGKQGHNLQAKDSIGNDVNLYDIGGQDFTILFFYEPSCGHCRTTTPELVKFYDKYKNDPRIKVVAFYMLTDKKEWMEFIRKHKMENLENVWDPDRTSFYWYWYDTSTTPQIYVLDKEKNIFVKRIDVPTLEMIAEHELK